MKWITCTPIGFHGDEESFFSRDTGSFCRAFQNIGVDCTPVLPLEADKNTKLVDAPDLLRTDYKNLKDPKWWKQQNADAVLFYCWANYRYVPISKAIKKAGLKLVLYQDEVGSAPIKRGEIAYSSASDQLLAKYKEKLRGHRILQSIVLKFLSFLLFIFRCLISAPLVQWGRKKHFQLADLILFPEPKTLKSKKEGVNKISSKMALIGSAVFYTTQYHQEEKLNKIITIGRWNDPIKRSYLLWETIIKASVKLPSTHFFIYGTLSDSFISKYAELTQHQQEHIHLIGPIPHDQLLQQCCSSRMLLVTSKSEGTHLASAEGLCCGMSVVGPNNPGMDIMKYYASENSGTVASDDSADGLVDALVHEHKLWESGQRNPEQISNTWIKRVRADYQAQRIIDLLEGKADKNHY
ncbi:MAG: glycosyltransferase [Akkermansia sp.]